MSASDAAIGFLVAIFIVLFVIILIGSGVIYFYSILDLFAKNYIFQNPNVNLLSLTGQSELEKFVPKSLDW